MKEMDLIISKDQEIKRLNDQILNLTEKINNLNIAVGSKDEILKSKERELLKELELAKNELRVVEITKHPNAKCSVCGYNGNSPSRTQCASCGSLLTNKIETIAYKNLDDVKAEIKKEVETKAKKSISELENVQLDLEIKIEDLQKALERKEKSYNNEKEEWEERTRKRYNKQIEGHREEITSLKDEIVKIKKKRTDDELEAIRLEEVEKLRDANKKLIEKLVEAEKLSPWRRLLNYLFDRTARKEAIKEVLLINELNTKLKETKEWMGRSGYKYYSPYGSSVVTTNSYSF